MYLSTFQQGAWAKISIIKLFGVCVRVIKTEKEKRFYKSFFQWHNKKKLYDTNLTAYKILDLQLYETNYTYLPF